MVEGWAGPLLAAPFVGSFLGVLIRRLPRGEPVALARSRCERCGRALGSSELVPLLSYIALGGRCRTCRGRIGAFHPAVELAALAVALWAVLAAPDPAAHPAALWADCALGWTLLALAWIDWEHMRLPDALTLPLVPVGLLATLWLGPGPDPDGATDHALAATLGYAGFRAVELLYRRLRGRDGLGQGDAKLAAAAGAWVGLDGLGPVVLIAALAGLATGLLRAMRRPGTLGDTLGAPVPFGPCLALATWVVRLHGGASAP